MTFVHRPRSSSVGDLLRTWRKVRVVSQLDLALKAGISSRHLSFVETGRAQASRAVILQLGESLELPLRDRNALLSAAGYAPVFGEGPLDGPELERTLNAIQSLLEKLEPYPTWLLDRLWNIHRLNRSAVRLANLFIGRDRMVELAARGPINVLHLILAPDLLKPYMVNWEDVVPTTLARVRREAAGRAPDPDGAALLDELLDLPGLPSSWKLPDPDVHAPPIIPVLLRKGEVELEFITTITTLGRPQDVVLQELCLESCVPGNAETEEFFRSEC